VGSVRVGLAVTDPDRLLASPLSTIAVPVGEPPSGAISAVVAVVAAESVAQVVVGLPLSLSGKPGAAAEGARDFAVQLQRRLDGVPVRLVDERFTTTTAHQAMAASGRSSRARRAAIDQAAAVVLLQHVIDADRAAGPTGRRIGDWVTAVPAEEISA